MAHSELTPPRLQTKGNEEEGAKRSWAKYEAKYYYYRRYS